MLFLALAIDHSALAAPMPDQAEIELAQAQDQAPGASDAAAPADQSPAMQGGRGGGGMMGGPMGMCPMMTADDDKNFSAEQVRDILEGQIAWSGNKRLKVGSVEQKDEDSYLAEIVTVDDSLVQRLEVDRASGAMRPVE